MSAGAGKFSFLNLDSLVMVKCKVESGPGPSISDLKAHGGQGSNNVHGRGGSGGNTQTKVLFYHCRGPRERERGRERGGRPMWTDRGWCISERRRRVRAGERVRWSRSGMLHNWLAGLLLRTDRQTDHERLHGLVCLHLQSILHSLPRERQQNVFTIRTECSKQLWLISMLIRSIDLIKAAHAQYASQDSPNIAPQRIFKMTSRSNVTNTYACVARSKGYSSPIFQRNIDCY